MTPEVSVVMAAYNSFPYVKNCVDSILNQSFNDFEFIIIDDGSTDGTGDYLQNRAKLDHRIHLIQQQNQGLTKSLNKGLKIAKGEFIARIDADDIAVSNRFEKQVNYLNQHQDVVLLGSSIEMMTADGLPMGLRILDKKHSQIRKKLLQGDSCALSHPAVMFRKDVAIDIGGYDESYPVGQDLDFFLRMSEKGKVENLPDSLLFWRQHKQSVNRTQFKKWADVKRRAVKSTIMRVGLDNYLEELFENVENFSFPSYSFQAAKYAELNGRFSTALRLYFRELTHGNFRVKAVILLLKCLVHLFIYKLRTVKGMFFQTNENR
jgi:glycosyltransferase involved in cell wall biosynthesis